MPNLSNVTLLCTFLLVLFTSIFTPSAVGSLFRTETETYTSIPPTYQDPTPLFFSNPLVFPTFVPQSLDPRKIIDVASIMGKHVDVASIMGINTGTPTSNKPKGPYHSFVTMCNFFPGVGSSEYRGIDCQTRCKAVLKNEKEGVNITDYILALNKAVGICNDTVVDALVSKNFDLNSKSKSLLKRGGKSAKEDVYDVIDCALVTSTKCEDLLYAARTGDIGKFDVSGSYFKKCKLKDEYTPLDILVAMG